jgi:endogenous inhibitor of DNA gyrase (YacG/DUF329 family)
LRIEARRVVLDPSQSEIRNPKLKFPMRCPVCNREFDATASSTLPFCSERCRTIDLGRWLGESYGIPVAPDPEADEIPDETNRSNGASTANGQ